MHVGVRVKVAVRIRLMVGFWVSDRVFESERGRELYVGHISACVYAKFRSSIEGSEAWAAMRRNLPTHVHANTYTHTQAHA